jgi:hypothetical protein
MSKILDLAQAIDEELTKQQNCIVDLQYRCAWLEEAITLERTKRKETASKLRELAEWLETE